MKDDTRSPGIPLGMRLARNNAEMHDTNINVQVQ